MPDSVEILDQRDPAESMKAVKNAVEIDCTRKAHEKDGAAMVQFIKWVKEQMASGAALTELDAAGYAERCRKQQDGYKQPSFDTIAGYASNGAIVHYSATEESNETLQPEGFLLVDSGGQYTDGTTDITRTIAVGPLTQEMKEHYTLVLKGHIALAAAQLDDNTSGAELDAMARGALNARGLNYNHGTGHGVGHLLSVHEGPNTINPRAAGVYFKPGMITSDEPGLYLEGKYGIRLENEILCVKDEEGDNMHFETITWCPWERDAIVKNMMSTDEIRWVDEYHETVYRTLSPYLDDETRMWLAEAAAPL
jgi:Xaa-Pro aminopeptidase